MKIGIDARLYGPRNRGLGRYIQKLIEHLEKIDQKNQYIIFLRRANWDNYQPKNSNFKKILADYRWYSLKEQIFMPWKIWQQKLDLIHFPHYDVPIISSIFPASYGIVELVLSKAKGSPRNDRRIVTIHDLVITRFPNQRATTLNPLLYKIKFWAYRLVIWLAVKRAKKIITVSEFSKKEIIDYFKLPSEKIVVTYEGVDKIANRKSQIAKNSAQQILININKYQSISSPYLLYVGAAYPHKNLENLLKAFKILTTSYNLKSYKLVLVGEQDYFYKKLKQEVKKLGLQKKVSFTGYLDDQTLNQVYQNALCYVFPSYYEGFGLPGLEAMAQGVPVIASQAGSLPEILGQAALYFDPHDVEDMARVINKVINDEALRKDMIKKGFEQIKKFNWEKCAKETLEIYLA
jgi:glycosyltransferase involved in cell wall biosynthesis